MLTKKIKMFFSFLFVLFLTGAFVSSSFAAEYWISNGIKLKMINGVTNGEFVNKANPKIVFNDGTTYNMQQTATAAMNAFNNATKAKFSTNNPGTNSKIYAYGEKYGENGLNGWVLMYKSSTDTTPMNPGVTPPDNHWAYAEAHVNAYHLWDVNPMNYDERVSVYLHEIGHALGLYHAKAGVPSVMRNEAQRRANKWFKPQPDDIKGVNDLYNY